MNKRLIDKIYYIVSIQTSNPLPRDKKNNKKNIYQRYSLKLDC